MQSKRTAADIVDAVAAGAHALFLERSPSAVSVREIAAAADVNLGLIHRYVGSKDDIIALVLDRHTERARSAAADVSDDELMARIAEIVVTRPATGRLLAGMILDGVDVADLKGEFPLLDQLRGDGQGLAAPLAYALALGWEVFGPSLLAAGDAAPSDAELADAVRASLNAVRHSSVAPPG